MRSLLTLVLVAACGIQSSAEAAAYACGGAALSGGAQLLCSHIDPRASTQSCTFFWTLRTTENLTSVVQGSFLLPPGASNALVYQGFGFDQALADPVILCQGQHGHE